MRTPPQTPLRGSPRRSSRVLPHTRGRCTNLSLRSAARSACPVHRRLRDGLIGRHVFLTPERTADHEHLHQVLIGISIPRLELGSDRTLPPAFAHRLFLAVTVRRKPRTHIRSVTRDHVSSHPPAPRLIRGPGMVARLRRLWLRHSSILARPTAGSHSNGRPHNCLANLPP
jgi:hypothetical protein